MFPLIPLTVHLSSKLEFFGIPRNSQKFPWMFLPIPKYSQNFQGFFFLLICMSGNKLEVLGIPRFLGIHFALGLGRTLGIPQTIVFL